jgi:hypothetical protein
VSTLTGGVSGLAAADGPMPGGTANPGLVHRIANAVRRPVAPSRAATPAFTSTQVVQSGGSLRSSDHGPRTATSATCSDIACSAQSLIPTRQARATTSTP